VTNKTITLNTKKGISEIEKGTILKGMGDMFIVTEVVREHSEDPIHDALFLSNPPKPYRFQARRVEGKYQLTSFSTGTNYFNGQDSLIGLLRKICDDGRFELVNSIEFKEN
jgi:hypothetical protein